MDKPSSTRAFLWVCSTLLACAAIGSGCQRVADKGYILCTAPVNRSVVRLDLGNGGMTRLLSAESLGASQGRIGNVAYDATRGDYYFIDGGRQSIVRHKSADDSNDVVYHFDSVISVPTPEPLRALIPPGTDFAYGARIAVTPDGKWLFFSAQGKGLYRWHIDEGTPELLLPENGDTVTLIRCVASKVFVGRATGLYVLDPRDGLVRQLLGHIGRIIDVSPNGTFVIFLDGKQRAYEIRRVDGTPLKEKLNLKGFNVAVGDPGVPPLPQPLFIGESRVAYLGLYRWVWTMPEYGLMTYDFITGKNRRLAESAGLRMGEFFAPRPQAAD